MAIRYQDENGNWVTEEQTAVETTILDISGNFESSNVEGALRELAEKTANAEVPAELEAQVKANTTNIKANAANIKKIQQQIQDGASSEELNNLSNRVNILEQDMTAAKEDIEYLKVNGGGGGGSAVPTIKSDFTDCAIDKGTDVIIPIFFSSPNMGDGTAYILVNNIQVDSTGIKQGNNNIRVKAQYLINTDNKVAIYAKDRAGIVTNQLSWTIIAGGIELTSTFDYEIDYGITDTIRIPYTIDTGISGTATLHFTIDNNTTEYTCSNGTNYIDINASDIGLGTHPVSMYATIDKYTSRTLSFNIVIISTTELYLSSTFISGSEFTYGELVSINYRLSKLSTEEFNVYLKIDDVVKKTQKLTVGSYFWTLNNLAVGPHKITIQAVSLDYSEDKSIDLELTIVEGEYAPVEDYTLGLLCDLNAVGRNNDDDAVVNQNKWIDASGNGHDGQLKNFNFGTNGFVNDTLVCDNDAYVVIPWSPWENNALNGSTFDIIYTPINSGVEDCRVLDYTQITDDLSTDEIKPFKGIFADVLRGISSSASSGASAGKVKLDDENGEIHLTWVLDRTNKFMKTYIDGVLCRIMFLTDSGVGVNKFYEDFSLDEYIYLNSTKGLNCGTNNIKRFRVYDHALTSEQVLQNHLANITDLDKQKQMYDFNYNNTTLPKMYLNGDITNMTAYQTVPMSIEYISPNEERYGQSFNTGIQNNPVKIQGTSSLQYVRKNYTIYLKDEYGADMYYNPYGPGSVADYVFCLKADYVESSHANNTGCARFVNDCLYDTKTPMQLDNENCRTTINGFPIEVYMNGEYLGVYNFNHDRYSYQSYGYDYKRYPNLLVYEINSNSNTSAGAFYRYGDNVESSTGITELEYYKRDFNLIYGNRTTDSDTYSEIKTLVEWVSVAEQDLFRETISEHFNTEYLFRYFLMVLLIGAVDSLGKNLKIMTIDGKVWYPTFYDMDTVLGIDNTGYLTIEPDVEIESGSYNTSNSNLWNKVWNFFRQELKEEWSAMRQGRFTLDNLMDYIYGQQISVIPPKYYNDDAEVKYLQFGSLYTYCCHGNKEHQIRRWLRERIAYVDSMLGYFTSQEDQVTIRMNKTGHVSFDITTYIPLYFSVKWSNATGGTQTFKMKRGETKTFYYTSTTSTDQEVIIYHAQYIKALDNLSNLNPSSCILANARKLTNVEIHSTELYNINVTNNTFLRTINLENCSTLGTVTATGSSLNLSNCKYLRYCNVYNTALTEVQLNTSGGSLIEILYPKTIQSINLIKQRLLEKIGLPYGSNGDEIPTSLYTISIQECPSIKYLNTSDNDAINSTFASMVYCNNLTIRNSLDLRELDFNGFYRLKNVIIENMYNLEQLGFNNLLPAGEQSTLQYMGLSNCPLLKTIELNCTSNDYEITLADNAILNFGGLFGLQSIVSNCVLKGLKTIIVPQNLESMYFTTEYGTGYSTVRNIWVSSVCSVNTAGATVKATHVDSTFEGIDFAGMHLKNIDLGALVNIPKAINFSLSPTHVNPHFNLNRDGETYPYLKPEGTLDLSNYTESLARFFDGVDLDKLQIVCNNKLPQTDLSYCFYNSSFSTNDAINKLLTRVSSITNLDYCFYRTTINSVDILDEINMGASSSMNYTFAECPNIKTLNNVVIPSTVTSVEGMFNKCPLTTITNMIVNVQGSIRGLFKGCNKLTTINTLRIPNVTDVSGTFDGCTSLSSLGGFELPSSCTNVSNLFNGCYMLTELGMEFGANITAGDNWYPPNLETLHDTIISNDYVKLTNCTTLKTLNGVNISGGDLSDLFNGCINLANINNCTFNATTSLARAFKGCAKITINPITTIVDTITDISEMYSGCTGITDISGMTFGSGITNATDCIKDVSLVYANNVTIKSFIDRFPVIIFNNMSNLISAKNLRLVKPSNIPGVTINNMFSGCVNLEDVNFVNPPNFSYCKDTFKATSIGKNTNGIVRLYEDLGIPVNSLSGSNGMGMFKDNPYIKEFIFPDEEFGVFYAQELFNQCTNLKIVRNLRSSDLGLMFRFCKGASDVELINCYITIPFSTDGCEGITKLTNCTIPDHITNIDNFFKDMRITDISGLTIGSGVTSATDWITNCPITTANNVTIKNDLVKFKGCTTLTTCLNLDVRDVTDMREYFSGCSNLTNISIYPPRSACHMTELCYRCSNLINIEYLGDTKMKPIDAANSFREIGSQFNYEFVSDKWDFSNCTNVSYMFYGDVGVNICMRGANLSVLARNLQPFLNPTSVDFTGSTFNFTFNITSLSETFFYGIPNLILDDCSFSGELKRQFNYGNSKNSSLKTISMNNVTLLDDLAKDWSNIFYNCTALTSDIVIPSSVTNCTNAFKGCTGMTHVHSNWNNSYDNGITSTDCYAGCTGITHIDDKNVIAYEGDSGLDAVPTAWGGNGFSTSNSGVYEVEIPSDSYTIAFTGSIEGEGKINWGDGTVTTNEREHTYNTSGTYKIKSQIWHNPHNITGNSAINTNLKSSLTKVYRVPKDNTNGYSYSLRDSFRDCSKLTYADLTNLDVDRYDRVTTMFQGCTTITEIRFPNGFLRGCTNNNEGASSLFYNCSSLQTIDVSNWDTSNVRIMAQLFYGCSSLTSLDLSSWNTSNVTDMNTMFSGCTKLQTITGLENWNTSKVTNMLRMFQECSSLTTLNVSNWNTSNVTNMQELFFKCAKLQTIIGIENLNTSKVTTMYRMFRESDVTSIDTSVWDISNVTNIADFCNWCYSLKNLTLSFSLTYSAIFHQAINLEQVTFKNCNITLGNYAFVQANNLKFQVTMVNSTIVAETADSSPGTRLSWNENLTVDSLMSMINSLKDRSSTTPDTFTIGSKNLAKLSTAQKKVATNKNWTLA